MFGRDGGEAAGSLGSHQGPRGKLPRERDKKVLKLSFLTFKAIARKVTVCDGVKTLVKGKFLLGMNECNENLSVGKGAEPFNLPFFLLFPKSAARRPYLNDFSQA